jgi:hypothetical protein
MRQRVISVHESICRIVRHERFAHPADAAGRNLDSRELGAAEGWNPGFADDACFAAADPEGFFIGELDGAPAATVSCVNYGASFAFLGFYIVREDLRGRGYGLRYGTQPSRMLPTRDRARWRGSAAAELQNVRLRTRYANVRYGGTVAARMRRRLASSR